MTLHILFSPKAEGCPRLALDLIHQERLQTGQRPSVAFLTVEPDDLLSEFEARCAGVYHLGWSRKGFIGLAWRAWTLLRRVKPDGVVVYTLGQHLSIGVAARLQGIPVVVHVGCRPPFRNSTASKKLVFVMRIGAFFVGNHIACSDVVADDCRNYYGLRNVVAVPNGTNLSKWLGLRKRQYNEDAKLDENMPFKFAMVGSLEPSKNHEVLIRALPRILIKGGNPELHLIGEGSMRRPLEELAKALGVHQLIVWHGTLSDVGKALALVDLFVYAAKEEEGLGIALVEALAAGLPVVASDVPACREVLEGGRRGRLVPGDDPEAWADALLCKEPIAIPPVDALARYDIAATWGQYRRSLDLDAASVKDG
ncbi:hypothetical protein CKO42_19780 [Lamprobacter modestohalophilus]|uniref:Glycosyltransferase subfamily 4-like N-terminal domain-containing protein n=1 Tax=Lamprobacter modestohalophilus TaxID=1064514 RepID=A0A9X1B6F4_9GAMM|nr:glycosyltransferase [Lamprobacter modestohalophilus]MBK1620627.1 hypothetical protein [Lamprobacter modestohalophilus]